jgi:hypothetical protein
MGFLSFVFRSFSLQEKTPIGGFSVDEGVSPVLVMGFIPADGRIKHTNHSHLGLCSQLVLLMAVKGVEGAGFKRVDLAVFDGLDFPFALDAVNCFDVVFIPHIRHGSRFNDGVVQGKATTVLLQKETAANPGFTGYFAVCADDVVQVAYDHGIVPFSFGE